MWVRFVGIMGHETWPYGVEVDAPPPLGNVLSIRGIQDANGDHVPEWKRFLVQGLEWEYRLKPGQQADVIITATVKEL